ncbi:MAG: GTPase HflX [Lachnospiraceae bacterium]|jgi:GTP-binding protein HflX|nr:GTPase HflX [Lachnospiraceae bacterium]
MANITDLKDTGEKSRAVLAGVNTLLPSDKYTRSMQELKGLAEACDLEVVSMVVQNAAEITHRTYMGSGKVGELKDEIAFCDADVVIFNESLSPLQVRNLEKELDTEVLDKTGIILQIFSRRARTREATLQVETARLKYILPRLAGMHAELSRQGGGSGRLSNKGAGEQKLELDRRRIEHRISQMEKELRVVDRERETQRSRRLKSGMARIALVGYTNAGKSTLMNTLLERFGGEGAQEKKVLEKDMLFATLDTSVRKIEAPGHMPFLLSDTVGFISDLPHSLVKAFRSTLEEVCQADLLLEIIDFSDPECQDQIEVTGRTLKEIGAGSIPILHVYNKCDLAKEAEKAAEDDKIIFPSPVRWGRRRPSSPESAAASAGSSLAGSDSADTEEDRTGSRRRMPASIPFVRDTTDPAAIYLSAKKGIGIEELLSLIDQALGQGRSDFTLLIPYTEGALLQDLRTRGMLTGEVEYLPEGIRLTASCSADYARRFSKYIQ